MEEKKAQIDFLQTQLEQRIKNNRQAENLRNQLMTDLEQSRNANENILIQFQSMKDELARQQEENGKLQMVLNERE